MSTPSDRPYFSHARIYAWNGTLGIAFHKGADVVAHLTADEAIELSNRLVDLAERIKPSADDLMP